jgi:hypothetical protein
MNAFFHRISMLTGLILWPILSMVAQMDLVIVNEEGQSLSEVFVYHTTANGNWIMTGKTDELGHLQASFPRDIQSIHLRKVGFIELDTVVRLPLPNPFTLVMKSAEVIGITVEAESGNLAKRILKQAIDQRKTLSQRDQAWHYRHYSKLSLNEAKPDTSVAHKDSVYLAMSYRDRPIQLYQIELKEFASDCYLGTGNQIRSVVFSANEHTKDKPSSDDFDVGFTIDYGEHDVVPEQWLEENPYLVTSQQAYQEFSLYNRLLNLPAICDKDILSPIGEGALLSYHVELNRQWTIDTTTYYRLAVRPVFPGEPAFTGTLDIRGGDWALIASDLWIPGEVTKVFHTFHIQQEYQWTLHQSWFCDQQQIQYTIKDGPHMVNGSVEVRNYDYQVLENEELLRGGAVEYVDEAWTTPLDSIVLPVERSLTALERDYAHHCDSLQQYYSSGTYQISQDSLDNELRFMDFIVNGIYYKNREKDYQFFINPLIMQTNFLGIGGYRHRLGGTFVQRFDNGYTLETQGDIDYGFRNGDVRGKIGAGLTYMPLRFMRTFVRVGDYYDMINNYASLGSLFSRSNYVRTKSITIEQRMEVVNGLFAEVILDYSDQLPIFNLQADRWSANVFGEINQPIEFERYTKTEVRIGLKYRIKQPYVIRKKRKILLDSSYPEVYLNYRKGLPRVFNSQVNFDFLELGAQQHVELGRFGTVDWSVLTGSFVNKKNLRLLEHRYFRGSDLGFFSNPTNSFQLLGPTLSTPNAFLRANYFQHFNGILFNKIPFIRRLKLTEAAGAAMLSIPSQQFHQVEFYAGVERVVRIRRELFRFGLYACTADSSWNNARFEWKFGINFYNSYTKRWMY